MPDSFVIKSNTHRVQVRVFDYRNFAKDLTDNNMVNFAVSSLPLTAPKYQNYNKGLDYYGMDILKVIEAINKRFPNQEYWCPEWFQKLIVSMCDNEILEDKQKSRVLKAICQTLVKFR